MHILMYDSGPRENLQRDLPQNYDFVLTTQNPEQMQERRYKRLSSVRAHAGHGLFATVNTTATRRVGLDIYLDFDLRWLDQK